MVTKPKLQLTPVPPALAARSLVAADPFKNIETLRKAHILEFCQEPQKSTLSAKVSGQGLLCIAAGLLEATVEAKRPTKHDVPQPVRKLISLAASVR